MAKKKKQPPEKWENQGFNERFERLYIGQLTHPAMLSLKPRAFRLYVYMKLQYKGKETKSNPNGKKEQFYCNWKMMSKDYPLYNNKNSLYSDIKVLIEQGFIECVERNKNTRDKNVYAFSDKWTKVD